MTESNQAHNLLAALRAALHTLDATLGLTHAGVDAIVSQVERLHTSVEALCNLQQREATPVGIDMLVDTAADFLAAFRELESGILDAQADMDMLESELVDDANGQEA
jgi:hypothetical protein